MERVTQMIAEQRPAAEILGALCQDLGGGPGAPQVAVFVLEGSEWKLAAAGGPGGRIRERLARVDPESLSESLLRLDAALRNQAALPFAGGWARPLHSGAGELLGVLVGLADGPVIPAGVHAERIRTAASLAALALEHCNLLADLQFKADHDPLTGLFNRCYYERALESLCSGGGASRQAVLLWINLDRFRVVNDVMGHATGNRLLAQVGQRFRARLPDGALLARVGGDEFAALFPDTADADAGVETAGRLLATLAEPFTIDGNELFASASIGIGRSAPGGSAQSLEREAHLALRRAKQAGKARAVVYDPSMAATPPERLEMERRLRFALARGEVLLYYQPQVDLSTGLVTGAEALLRWRPEGLGMLSPAAFIPILEETGLIFEFGRWVLGEACRQAREWHERAGIPFRIAVNVSALQFASGDFPADVGRALEAARLTPGLLEIELTESVFIGDFAAAVNVFRDLKKLGVSLAIDDFGTGQSSLSYLHKLPFQRLKIDQSFVRPLEEGGNCGPLVKSIIRMAASLGMTTIAEGVETARQAALMRSMRCREAQGFYYARPLPAEAFLTFLVANRRRLPKAAGNHQEST